jgi:hypothetical protein
MVRNMDDYESRVSDDRFKKWDDLISQSDSGRKVSVILTIGSVICIVMLGMSLFSELGKPTPQKYDYGLNISYDSPSSSYFIDYTNPNNTVSSIGVNVKIPYSTTDASAYTTIYETSTSTFPVNISYKPYNKNMEHIVMVTLVKPTGNYTCFFTNVPSDDDKMYENVIVHTDGISKYLSSNNITS